MSGILATIERDHVLWLVCASFFVCLFGSRTALSHLRRANAVSQYHNIWVLGSAICMGLTVWATHFIAFLAYYDLAIATFDVPLTVFSGVLAIVIAFAGITTARTDRRLIGGGICGVAAIVTFYSGLAAFRGPFAIEVSQAHIAASVIVAMVVGGAAFKLGNQLGERYGHHIGVGLFVLAIMIPHFISMSGASVTLTALVEVSTGATFQRQALALIIALATILLLAAGWAGAGADSYLSQRNAAEAERLRLYVSKLETTKAELEETTAHLSKALDAAAASSNAKSAFLATMSHELRTPLNSILGFSEIIRDQRNGAIGNPVYAEYAREIHTSGTQLLNVITDVLNFGKLESGQMDVDLDDFDLNELLELCVENMQSRAAESEVSVLSDLPGTPTILYSDQLRLRHIIVNLLSNAVKFTPAGGEVRVCYRRNQDGLEIEVTDTGIGMSPDQIPLAVEPFAQIDNRVARRHDGTGLGLALCVRLTALLGGTLKIESEPGKGTRVVVAMPATCFADTGSTDDVQTSVHGGADVPHCNAVA